MYLIDAEALEREGWYINRIIQKNKNTMEYQTRKPTEFHAIELPRKTGKWIENHEPYTWMGYTYWSCSNCGFECGYDKEIRFKTDFCPNCGAANCGIAIKGEQNETD